MAGGGAVGTGGGVSSSSRMWEILMASFAAFGGILFGYDTGTIGGIIAMKNWLGIFGTLDTSSDNTTRNPYLITTSNKSLVVSILSAGTFVGALLSNPIADGLGRKWGLVFSCLIFSVGVGMQLDTHWAVFVLGRVVAGMGVGAVSTIVPMYQSECAPKSIRGAIVGLYQFSITIGALLSAIVLNATKDKNSHAAWRIPIAVQFAWAAILAGGMMCLPESPRYLLHKNKPEQARAALGRLMSLPATAPQVEAEAIEVQLALDAERAIGKGSYWDCFKPGSPNKNAFRTWTGIWMQAWQQLTGINFIMYYGTTFFKSSGIGNPFIITIITDVVNTVMTIVGVNLIDRVGRRKLLLIGALGMMFCEYIVAIVGVTVGKTDATGQAVNLTAQRVLIAFVCFYIAFFATSWGPVIWVLTGELFPLAVRAKSMSLAVASNWLWNFGIGYATPYLVDPSTTGPTGIKTAHLGVKVFFIWGSTCAGCFIFTYFCIPETKGLSLEQIDLLYRESSIIGSDAYRAQMLAQNETFTHHDRAIGGVPADKTSVEYEEKTV